MKFYPDKKYAFDLDGTLITCKEKQLFVWSLALPRSLVNRSTLEKFWRRKMDGENTRNILLTLNLSKDEVKLAEEFFYQNIENQEYQFLDKPKALLRKLVTEKLEKILIISARQFHDLANIQLNNLIPTELKYELVTVRHKGVVENKAKILKSYNVDEYFGDSEIDRKACELANIHFQFVSDGQRNKRFVFG